MSDVFIADSSVALAWIIGNQATDATRELLIEIRTGATVLVPSLWFFEVANSLLVAVRRKLISPEARDSAVGFFRSLRLVRDDEAADEAMLITLELAQRYGLTVYDAAYLELARRKMLPLATRDHALQSAAKKCGVTLL